MTAAAVLDEARRLGVGLSVVPGGKLRWRCSRPLQEGLRKLLALHKCELLGLLSEVQAEDEEFIRRSLADEWGVPADRIWLWTPPSEIVVEERNATPPCR